MTRTKNLCFNVMRNGGRIGQHSIGFRAEGGILIASISLEIMVRLGPIPLFRYSQKVSETWRDGGFLTFESETDENGKRHRVRATRTAENVIVESSTTGRKVFGPQAIPLTHWNVLCMERPLFNPQDGASVPARVEARGDEVVALADGGKVQATRYSLLTKPVLDNWYDGERVWTALRTSGTDGSTIEYRRAE
jgi:Family of unknown function (DUF6134)